MTDKEIEKIVLVIKKKKRDNKSYKKYYSFVV